MDVSWVLFLVLWLPNWQIWKLVERKPLISEEVNWMFPKIVGFPPKSSILIGFSIIFTIPYWGTTIFGNTQLNEIPGEEMMKGWPEDDFEALILLNTPRFSRLFIETERAFQKEIYVSSHSWTSEFHNMISKWITDKELSSKLGAHFSPKPWGIITKSHDVRPWRLTPATFSGDSKCSEQPQGQGPTENSQKTRTRHGTISSFHGGEPWIGGGSHSEWDPQQGCWYQQPWQEWYRRCHFSPRYLWNPFYPR